jgi:23S rRNA (adenine-N6)-dimethyltransferase
VSGYGHGTWGWHRLAPAWADRLVADAGVTPGDLVLDIGAGTGALTAPLVAAGARVIAVELHPGRAAALRRRFAGDGVVVVHADAADLRLPRRPFRVVASVPFAQTTAILGRLLAPGSRLARADLVVQRAAARRWTEGRAPGAGRWGRHYAIGLGRRVPRQAFTPPPKVDCAVLRIERSRSVSRAPARR